MTQKPFAVTYITTYGRPGPTRRYASLRGAQAGIGRTISSTGRYVWAAIHLGDYLAGQHLAAAEATTLGWRVVQVTPLGREHGLRNWDDLGPDASVYDSVRVARQGIEGDAR